MYKLILVDDEEEVRKGILNRIEWDKIGYEIAGEAENGIEALDIAEKIIPDVLVTDIKMPFMDGISLAERIKERFPSARIIILTGFDEFEYAKKAVKLSVEEYLLKPISRDELTQVLVKTKVSLDQEIAQKKDMEILKEHYIKSLPILREKFLYSLISGRLGKDEIISKSQFYGLNLCCEGAVALVISIDWASCENYEIEENKNYGQDREIIKLAALSRCEEVIPKYGSGIAFISDDYVVIIYTFRDDESKNLGKVVLLLDEIRRNIERYHNFRSTAGVGTFCSDISKISLSYENAVMALDYRLILGGGRTICIEDVEPSNIHRVTMDSLKEHRLISSIKVGNTGEIVDTINGLLLELVDTRASIKDYQLYLLEILTAILKTAKESEVDMDKLFGINYNLFVELYKFKDLNEVKDWLINICVKIKGYILKGRQDTCKSLVKSAVEYLQKNYGDCDITVDRICRHLHISPTYFSVIFKKETGLTFVNYLTSMRMEAAKELLIYTGLKTFEIAYKVGYSEPNYFSYCFKKHFSISPSEYRKKFNAV